VFSVGGGFVSGSFVGIGDLGQVSDHGSVNLFVGGIDFVMFSLGINILLFKGI